MHETKILGKKMKILKGMEILLVLVFSLLMIDFWCLKSTFLL